jgi:aldehyde dehydrogenase (NAD+)
MGKILPEGLGDVQEAIDMGYYMAGEGRRPEAEEVPLMPTVGGR